MRAAVRALVLGGGATGGCGRCVWAMVRVAAAQAPLEPQIEFSASPTSQRFRAIDLADERLMTYSSM
jgi:hypothetical protein